MNSAFVRKQTIIIYDICNFITHNLIYSPQSSDAIMFFLDLAESLADVFTLSPLI